MKHPTSASPEVTNHINESMESLHAHLHILIRMFPDCETNSTVVASLIGSAVALRAKHIVSHFDGKAPPPSVCNEELETFLNCGSEAFTRAINLAVAAGPIPPTSNESLLHDILNLVAKLHTAASPKADPLP
jgi:hypothetical protein